MKGVEGGGSRNGPWTPFGAPRGPLPLAASRGFRVFRCLRSLTLTSGVRTGMSQLLSYTPEFRTWASCPGAAQGSVANVMKSLLGAKAIVTTSARASSAWVARQKPPQQCFRIMMWTVTCVVSEPHRPSCKGRLASRKELGRCTPAHETVSQEHGGKRGLRKADLPAQPNARTILGGWTLNGLCWVTTLLWLCAH